MPQPIPPAPEPAWRRQPLRVPRDDRSLLSVPPLGQALAPARDNRARLDASGTDLQGRTLGRLRAWTRELALSAAAAYARELGVEPAGLAATSAPERPLLFVTGHQPSLFHPGVWAKNFAAQALARAAGGTGLNLIIDNDVVATRGIRVPSGDCDRPAAAVLPFDQPQPPLPWEDAVIADRGLFEAFGERVVEAMQTWGISALAAEAWPASRALASRGAGLRDSLAAARVAVERRWGVENLELPLSRLCDSDPFRWFAAHVLAHLPRFQHVHNSVLAEYRQVNRVRSRTHPVPELAAKGPWLEAPFWIWRGAPEATEFQDQPRRRRVFARQLDRHVELSDGDEVFGTLRLRPDMDGCCAVEDLRELADRGLRFRTRALTTTLFARLCLADLFVHGIGGAKYDEMTDRIMARFFGLPPPEFLALSATLYPWTEETCGRSGLSDVASRAAENRRRITALLRKLRDLEFNADRVLGGGDPDVRALVEEKQRLIREQEAARAAAGLSRSQRRRRSRENHARHAAFRRVHATLAARAADERRRLEEQRFEAERQRAADAVLADREYSFVLFPEDKLRSFLTGLSL